MCVLAAAHSAWSVSHMPRWWLLCVAAPAAEAPLEPPACVVPAADAPLPVIEGVPSLLLLLLGPAWSPLATVDVLPPTTTSPAAADSTLPATSTPTLPLLVLPPTRPGTAADCTAADCTAVC